MNLKYFLLLTSLIVFHLALNPDLNVQISDQFNEEMEKEAEILPQRLNNIQSKQSLEDLNLGVNFTTYIGGDAENAEDQSFVIAIGSDNSIYITGWTASTDFPTTDNAFNRTRSGNGLKDIFVMKLSADGSEIIFSTFIGGTSSSLWNRAHVVMVLDSSDNVIISTVTSVSNFHTTPGAYDQSYNGDHDIIVAMLSADGSELLFSTFLGGSAIDTVINIEIDNVGNIYLSGNTGSTDFPTTAGAYNRTHSGSEDIFVAKLSADGSTLLFSTFLGGSGDDCLPLMALDSQNSIYIGGITSSVDYPTTMDALNTSSNGGGGFDLWGAAAHSGVDLVLSKLSANGSVLLYSTYIGGTDTEVILGIAIDSADNVIITGAIDTVSADNVTFPTTPSAYDPTFNGGTPGILWDDSFVMKIAADGSSILFSTYLGGSGSDRSRGIVVDSNDNIYITGETLSGDFPLEPEVPLDSSMSNWEVFVSKLSANGSNLLYSTYFGGLRAEIPFSIVLDGMDNVYVTGHILNGGLPTSIGTSVYEFGSRKNLFITKFSNSTINIPTTTTSDTATSDTTTNSTITSTTPPASTNFDGIPIILSVFVALITVRRLRKKED
ncbi:MAG: SBBP repeat-containing protein [Candidatus Hodarchaeales archaeon]|jgi:hypothetical protein